MIKTSINTTLLRNLIEESGLKMVFIAESLEITNKSLNNKINGIWEFRIGEIKKLCELLNIDRYTREKIFGI